MIQGFAYTLLQRPCTGYCGVKEIRTPTNFFGECLSMFLMPFTPLQNFLLSSCFFGGEDNSMRQDCVFQRAADVLRLRLGRRHTFLLDRNHGSDKGSRKPCVTTSVGLDITLKDRYGRRNGFGVLLGKEVKIPDLLAIVTQLSTRSITTKTFSSGSAYANTSTYLSSMLYSITSRQ